MGAGIPMTLVQRSYDRSMPTVAFLGDGGVGPFIGEAKIAVRKTIAAAVLPSDRWIFRLDPHTGPAGSLDATSGHDWPQLLARRI